VGPDRRQSQREGGFTHNTFETSTKKTKKDLRVRLDPNEKGAEVTLLGHINPVFQGVFGEGGEDK